MLFRGLVLAILLSLSQNTFSQSLCSEVFLGDVDINDINYNNVWNQFNDSKWLTNDDLNDAIESWEQLAVRDEAIQKLNHYKDREDLLSWYRKKNDTYERKSMVEARRKLLLFELYLKFGNFRKAHEIYQKLFRDVEYNYWLYQKRVASLNYLESAEIHNAEALVEFEQKRDLYNKDIEQALKQFGKNYVEYKIVRSYIESILESHQALDANKHFESETEVKKMDVATMPPPVNMDEETRVRFVKGAKWVFDQLGVLDYSQAQPDSSIPPSRVSLDEVKKLYRTQLTARLAKINYDIHEEREVRWLKVSYLFLKAIRAVLYSVPAKVGSIPARKIVSEFFSLSYDVYVRDNYVPKLEMISRVQGSAEDKLKLLMDINAPTKDELLLTFARIGYQTDTWNEIKNFANQKRTDSVLVNDFYNRMLAVEEKLDQFGALPLFFEESASDRFNKVMFTVVLPIAGSSAYVYWDQIQGWILSLWSLAAQ